MARRMTSNERNQILDSVSADSDIYELWDVYKVEYKRNYDPDEEVKRFQIFKRAVRDIVDNNEKHARGEVPSTWGISQFTDRRPEEMPHGLNGPRKKFPDKYEFESGDEYEFESGDEYEFESGDEYEQY